MAIAKMKKLHLIAMDCDKDKTLDILQGTQAVQLYGESEQTDRVIDKEKISLVSSALSILSPYSKTEYLAISYSDFLSYKEKSNAMDLIVSDIIVTNEEIKDLTTKKLALENDIVVAEIYKGIERDFSEYKLNKFKVFFGNIKSEKICVVKGVLSNLPLCDMEEYPSGDNSVICLVCGEQEEKITSLLNAIGFIPCPFLTGNGEQNYNRISQELSQTTSSINQKQQELQNFASVSNELKIYTDYLMYCNEKILCDDKMSFTQRTFTLKAYVPEEEVSVVESAILTIGTCYYEFCDIEKDDNPPVLMKNNKIIKNFESVTNLYSPPNYREFDPNTIMSIFFSLFLGFIMADFGYGVLMILVWVVLFLKNKKRDNGITRLFGVIAVGGIFTMLWGVLFNSYFGFSLPFYKAIMPDPQKDNWTLFGIGIPANLIIAMLLGILHLTVGYVCKAVQEFLRKDITEGLFAGIVWAIFMVALAGLILGSIVELPLGFLQKPSIFVLIGSLFIAVVTAGRREKFFGKFTKGFGALYGVINFLSDILSYARLYGLMLSGAILAQLIAQFSSNFISSGAVGIVGAVFLMVIGHGFNLAMGLLGAYIHDSRLQYVEFFSRFFEGEGELFRPLGSDREYSVQIKK